MWKPCRHGGRSRGSVCASAADLLAPASRGLPLGSGGTRLRGGVMQSVAWLAPQWAALPPDLSPAQRPGQALWVVGAELADSACLDAVCHLGGARRGTCGGGTELPARAGTVALAWPCAVAWRPCCAGSSASGRALHWGGASPLTRVFRTTVL